MQQSQDRLFLLGDPAFIDQVEEAEDIQKVPASAAGGSEKPEKVSTQNVESRAQETSSTNIDAGELPPHVVVEMPALSPTMVRNAVI